MKRNEEDRLMRSRLDRATRSSVLAVATVTSLFLTVSGCSGGDDGEGGDDKPSQSQGDGKSEGDDSSSGGDGGQGGQPIAEIKGEDGVTVKITQAAREDGGFVTISGVITNNSGEFWLGGAWKSDEKEVGDANPASVAGAKLVDKKGRKRYLILRDTDGKCLCTNFKGGIQDGKSKSWYAQFPAPPEGNDKVDFEVGDMPPAELDLSKGE